MAEKSRLFRVLHILDTLRFDSGVSSFVVNLFQAVDRNQVIFDFAVHKPCDEEVVRLVEKLGARVYILPDITTLRGLLSYKKAVRQLLRQQRYPIVHGHISNAAFLYLPEAEYAGVATRILPAHNPTGADIWYKKIRNRFLNALGKKWANHYFACSKAAADYLFGSRAVARKAVIFPNAICTKRFAFNERERQEVRQEWKIPEGHVCVGHVGRFAPQKNHTFVVKAFSRMQLMYPNSVLLLAGDGRLRSKVEREVSRRNISHCVRFLGVQKDIARVYQAMDILWLPSRFEGWGLVALEAQAAGLPCILSQAVPREVGCAEEVFWLPTRDPGLWAEKTLDIVTNQVRRDGQDAVRSCGLDMPQAAGLLLKLYDNYLENEVT